MRRLVGSKRHALAWSPLAAAALLVSACAVGPDYTRPSVAVPAHFKSQPPPAPPQTAWKPAAPDDVRIPPRWWEMYGDEELNSLESQVSVSNQSLEASYQAYVRAREQVTVDRSQLFPFLGASAGASRARLSAHRPLLPPGARLEYTDLSLTGDVSWELDLWGGVRRIVESSRAAAQASAAELAATTLSLQAQVAVNYFQLRAVDSQLQLLHDTVTAYQKSVELTSHRYKAGLSSAADLTLAQTQLDQTIAQATDLEVARAQYENALATLVGTPASSFSVPKAPLRFNPPTPPLTVPSEILQRRPDIAAAERRAAAANARIGVAQAAFYPAVGLTGVGGYESTSRATWLQGPSALWSLGATATEELFDAGRRRAVKRQAIADFEATAAQYRETVLEAFQEVEDALSAARILAREASEQQKAVADASRSVDLTTNLYKQGLASYLQVLTTQTVLLTNQRDAVDIAARQATANVRLLKSLGGGWNGGVSDTRGPTLGSSPGTPPSARRAVF